MSCNCFADIVNPSCPIHGARSRPQADGVGLERLVKIPEGDLAQMREEIAKLQAANDAMAVRFRWLEKLFDRKWNGVVGSGSAYRYDLIGPWRNVVQRLAGESLGEAIDAAMAQANKQLGKP